MMKAERRFLKHRLPATDSWLLWLRPKAALGHLSLKSIRTEAGARREVADH